MKDTNYYENATEYGPLDKSCKKGGIKKQPIILCEPEGAAILLAEGRTPVFLVRHGQTEWNLLLRLQGREHVDLNENGINQSFQCAKLLTDAKKSGFDPVKIYSSPLSRAKKTGDIIAKELGFEEATIEEGIIERDYGELSGLTLEERKIRFPKGEKQAENVESVPDTAQRMKQALVSITRGIKKDVIAVTHGGIINALFLQITRGKVGTGKTISENCGISIVAVNEKMTIPLAYNLTEEIFLDYVARLRKSTPKTDK